MPQWLPKTSTAQLDMLLGLLVGLGVILFIVTAALELAGQPALLWALVLLADVVLVAMLYRVRKRRRT